MTSLDNKSATELLGNQQPLDAILGADAKTSVADEAFDTLEEAIGKHVAAALGRTDYNVTEAAELLGIGRSTLYNYIRRFNLKK